MKIFKGVICLSLVFLFSCAQNIELENGQAQWDFDHNLQFKQTKLANNHYRLEVISGRKAPFSQLSTFLLRRSKQLCYEYGYKIEVLSGVEEFTQQQSFPNMMLDNLLANVECVDKGDNKAK